METTKPSVNAEFSPSLPSVESDDWLGNTSSSPLSSVIATQCPGVGAQYQHEFSPSWCFPMWD